MTQGRFAAEKIHHKNAGKTEILKKSLDSFKGQLFLHNLSEFGHAAVLAVTLATVGHCQLNNFDQRKPHDYFTISLERL
mgnify:CR=1 FL=1